LFFGRIEPELVDNKRFLLLGGHYGNDTRYYAVWDKNFKLTHYLTYSYSGLLNLISPPANTLKTVALISRISRRVNRVESEKLNQSVSNKGRA